MKEEVRIDWRFVLSHFILWLVCVPALLVIDFVPAKVADRFWDFAIWVAGGFRERV